MDKKNARREYEEAIKYYDEVLKKNPEDAQIWFQKGVALYKLGLIKKSEEDGFLLYFSDLYENSYDDNDKEEPVYLDAVYIPKKFEDFKKAISCFETTLQINPEYAEAWYYEGLCYLAIFDDHFLNWPAIREAKYYFEMALKINPKYGDAWCKKGIVLYKFHQLRIIDAIFRKIVAPSLIIKDNEDENFLKEALKCFKRAIKINPKDEEAWVYQGNILSSFGKLKKAIRCYNKALKINSKNVLAWQSKASALKQLGRYEEAIKCLDEALKINPKDIDDWRRKGELFEELNRPEEAKKCYDEISKILKYYDEILKINPEDISAWHAKATILTKLDRYEEANKCYDEISKILQKKATQVK